MLIQALQNDLNFHNFFKILFLSFSIFLNKNIIFNIKSIKQGKSHFFYLKNLKFLKILK